MGKKRLVIIGGGFAGSHTAKHLEKKFDTTLIDTKDYFEFTPGVLRTLVEPIHIRKIQVLHSHYLQKSKIIKGIVKEVSKNHVLVNNNKIEFDYLVISSGSAYNAPFKEHNTVTAFRAENLKKAHEELIKARKILIIGGGLVGVELAGEIVETYKKDKEIIIVNSGEKIIARNSRKAISFAEKFLKAHDVKIINNEKITNSNKGLYLTNKGRRIEADLAFLCTGIKPNYDFMKQNFSTSLNEKGYIKVNEFLQLPNFQNIFAVGDITSIKEEKTAQNAERQAEIIIQNICNLEKNKKLCEYKTTKPTLVISLGKYKAILTKGNFTWSGFIPSLLKSLIEKWEMMKKKKLI